MLAAKAARAFSENTELLSLFRDVSGFQSIAVAVSGGSDSMGLLHLGKRFGSLTGVQVVALTVDHGLRFGSAAEATWVAGASRAADVPHHILRWMGEKPKTGIQAKARQARYDLMTEWCRDNGVSALLTGHTLNDQAETYAMRAARTESPRSLASILPVMNWGGVTVSRPLLGVSRFELRHYLASNSQTWIDDPSNDDPAFERVRVRRALSEDEAHELASRAAAARLNSDEQSALAEDWLRQYVKTHQEGFFTVDRGSFRNALPSVQDRVLQRILRAAGGQTFETLLEERMRLARWLSADAVPPAGRRTLGGALIARRHEVFLVGRETGRIFGEALLVPEAEDVIWDQRFRVFAPKGALIMPLAAFPGLVPRLRDIPAFVQSALPCVKLEHGKQVLPQVGQEGLIKAVFLGL